MKTMRTIKFRGKLLDNGEWVYGDLEIRRIDNRCFIHTYNDDGIYFRQFEVIPKTVGQFTGIKDGKGTEIYKYDIIEVTLRHNKETVSTYIAVVDQKEGAFGFKNKQGFCPFYGQIHENYRVIGNIHDNPELMEGGEK